MLYGIFNRIPIRIKGIILVFILRTLQPLRCVMKMFRE